jgi:acetyl-CoA synthetase
MDRFMADQAVPKAFVLLTAASRPSRALAVSILRYTNERLAPYKRIRRIEFVAELPKTISGKIRRVQLRRLEQEGISHDPLRGMPFDAADLTELAEHPAAG